MSEDNTIEQESDYVEEEIDYDLIKKDFTKGKMKIILDDNLLLLEKLKQRKEDISILIKIILRNKEILNLEEDEKGKVNEIIRRNINND